MYVARTLLLALKTPNKKLESKLKSLVLLINAGIILKCYKQRICKKKTTSIKLLRPNVYVTATCLDSSENLCLCIRLRRPKVALFRYFYITKQEQNYVSLKKAFFPTNASCFTTWLFKTGPWEMTSE